MLLSSSYFCEGSSRFQVFYCKFKVILVQSHRKTMVHSFNFFARYGHRLAYLEKSSPIQAALSANDERF